jgi:hypothetical protein
MRYCLLSMTLYCFSTRCWLWNDVISCRGLSKGYFWQDTRCTNGIVDYLERYLVYGVG